MCYDQSKPHEKFTEVTFQHVLAFSPKCVVFFDTDAVSGLPLDAMLAMSGRWVAARQGRELWNTLLMETAFGLTVIALCGTCQFITTVSRVAWAGGLVLSKTCPRCGAVRAERDIPATWALLDPEVPFVPNVAAS